MKHYLTASFLILGVAGCGSSDSSDSSEPALDLDIQTNTQINQSSSHHLQITDLYIDPKNLRDPNSDWFVTARVYGDFDDDGDTDVFLSPSIALSETAAPSELYLNNGNDQFTLDTNFFPEGSPSAQAARKAITGDYNGDDKLDIFVVGHGIDVAPFSGEAPYLILSSETGMTLGQDMSEFSGFQHGAASADIDADGDLDIFVLNTQSPYFLINDGTGLFTKDNRRITQFTDVGFYTTELLDLDNDGYVDILMAGHEYEGFDTQILWGNSTGFYSSDDATILPSINGQGVVVDIDAADLNEDGHLDLIINRTADDVNGVGYYQGYYIQLLERNGPRQFVDSTDTNLASASDSNQMWIDWIHLKDMNNDEFIDIVADNQALNLVWLNDGNGHFTLQ